eukprot:1050133-Alexandrium_andersonii.AAC.1
MSASLVGSEMCIRDSPCILPGNIPARWSVRVVVTLLVKHGPWSVPRRRVECVASCCAPLVGTVGQVVELLACGGLRHALFCNRPAALCQPVALVPLLAVICCRRCDRRAPSPSAKNGSSGHYVGPKRPRGPILRSAQCDRCVLSHVLCTSATWLTSAGIEARRVIAHQRCVGCVVAWAQGAGIQECVDLQPGGLARGACFFAPFGIDCCGLGRRAKCGV